MNKYELLSDYLHDSQFVTLTVRNIYYNQTEIFFKDDEIYAGRTGFVQHVKYTQKQMYAALRRIQDRFRKRGIPIKGIKAYECGPAQDAPGAHPHLHWQIDGTIDWDDLYDMWHIDGYSDELWGDMVSKLLDGKMTVGQMKAELLVQMWMREFQEQTSRKGQDHKPCNSGTMKELFKYMTKLFTKIDDVRTVPLHIIDMIFEASVGVKAMMVTGFLTKRPRPDYAHMKEGPARDAAFEKYREKMKEYALYANLTKAFSEDVNEDLEGQEMETSETMAVDIETGELVTTPDRPVIVFVWKTDNWYCPEMYNMQAVRYKVSNKTRKLIASFNSS
jgi:DNA-binding transcriptional MerR regulator